MIKGGGEPTDSIPFPSSGPSSCHSYLLDTGIRFSHQEFRSQAGGTAVRARHGFSVFGDNNSSDCNGHGTHTAATVGGLSYGVAKNVTLWAVRAMDCAGGAKVSAILDVSAPGWAGLGFWCSRRFYLKSCTPTCYRHLSGLQAMPSSLRW